MAADDEAAEPSLVGRGIGSRAGGALRAGAKKLFNAGRVGARVNVEGIRQANTEFDSMLGKLRSIRVELTAINQLQGGSGGTGGGVGGTSTPMGGVGVGQSNPSLSRFSTMTAGFNRMTKAGMGVSLAASAVNTVMGPLSDRFNRNLQESIPISQGNLLLSSQYGMNYGRMEWDRVKAMGQFNLSRQDTLAAQSIGLAYGQSAAQTGTFLSNTVAPLVQASGGTLAPSQAAATAGTFLDPSVMRRAQAFNIPMGRIGGQVQNPLTTAMGYIKDYEKRYNIKLNNIDFQNLRSPGSATRYLFKRLYGLSDDAIDTVVQAGMQNNTFRSTPGSGGRDINFSSSADLSSIGLSQSRLGMKAFQYLTASTRREASFFREQEGAQVGKLGQDITIEDTLTKVENAFSDIIGPLGEFQRYIKLATGALQGLGALMIAKGVLGGLGGGGGLLGGGGGLLGGRGAAAGAEGAAATAGEAEGAAGAGAAASAGGVGGLAGAMGPASVAIGAAIGGTVLTNAAMKGGDSLGGRSGGVVSIVGGFAGGGLVGGARAIKHVLGGSADVKSSMASASGLTDAQLIEGIKNVRTHEGFGPKETARYDVWQQRRGALTAALIASVRDQTNAFDSVTNDVAAEIAGELSFFSSPSVTNDDKFNNKKKAFLNKVMPLIKANKSAMEIYRTMFGAQVEDPFDWNHPVDTPEANALITTSNDILGKSNSTGDPTDSGVRGAKGPTWDNLDARMKDRLSKLFAASGGRVWLGNGWRSEDQQKSMFLSRYTPDPNGDVTYQGKKWKRVRGAPAAPPGSSMHEIGLAADLEGDLNWVQQNAATFGLKTFASVNHEPWHVQPQELPNSRAAYEKGGGTANSNAGSGATEVVGDAGSGGRGSMGSRPNALSGVGFSLLNISNSGSSVASVGSSAASSTTAGAVGGGGSPTPEGGVLTSEQIAKMAYAAGFRGAALTTIVGIAQRESHGNAAAANESYKTGAGNKKDMSYGLTQINILPWLEKGQQAPWTSAQLMDPQFNLNVAYQMYQQRGFRPWSINGNPLARVDLGAASNAVRAAGYPNTGDPMPMGGNTIHIGHVSMNVTMTSTGQVQYDANEFANVAVARLQEVADTASRRGS